MSTAQETIVTPYLTDAGDNVSAFSTDLSTFMQDIAVGQIRLLGRSMALFARLSIDRPWSPEGLEEIQTARQETLEDWWRIGRDALKLSSTTSRPFAEFFPSANADEITLPD